MPTDLILIRGGNDIASTVAHRLFTARYPVLIVEAPQPATVRRGMSYASAIYDGAITLHGVTAVSAGTADEAARLLRERTVIPVMPASDGLEALLAPRVIVDGRYRKKVLSASRITDASLVIGLGPGFVAGVHAHVVVETNRGPNLGRILTEGEAEPYNGEPIAIQGHGRDRLLYAPQDGVFQTQLDIGSSVKAGDVIGDVGGVAVRTHIDGMLRGVVKNGLEVRVGAKLADVDPRGDPALLSRFSDKAWTIADAVLSVVQARLASGEASSR